MSERYNRYHQNFYMDKFDELLDGKIQTIPEPILYTELEKFISEHHSCFPHLTNRALNVIKDLLDDYLDDKIKMSK